MKSDGRGLEPTATFTDASAIFSEIERKLGFTLTSDEWLAAAREALAREAATGESRVGDVLAELEDRDPKAAAQIRALLGASSSAPPDPARSVSSIRQVARSAPAVRGPGRALRTTIAIVIGVAVAVVVLAWALR